MIMITELSHDPTISAVVGVLIVPLHAILLIESLGGFGIAISVSCDGLGSNDDII